MHAYKPEMATKLYVIHQQSRGVRLQTRNAPKLYVIRQQNRDVRLQTCNGIDVVSYTPTKP